MRFSSLVLISLMLAGCASHPGERVALHSANYGWIDEILDGDEGEPQRILGQLSMPDGNASNGAIGATDPVPAMVLVHSAQGRDAQMWMYADRFNAMGIATLALDSFTQRGILKIQRDQAEVTEAAMIADAYAALHLLAADPRIDANRIGIFGVSKGGAPAIYASLTRLAEALSPNGPRFALHIAYYPWCGVRFLDPVTTEAPILIQTGERDAITPASHCADLLAELEAVNPGLNGELVVHEGARHAFDHPYLAHIPAIPTTYLVPSECLFREVEPGLFVEESRDTEVTGENLSSVLAACSDTGFLAGGNPAAAEAAWQRTVLSLQNHLIFSADSPASANESW